MPNFRLRGEERSSSDQSCDTVIQLDTEGLVQSRTAPRLAQPEFVPIIPSLHPNKADMEDPEFTALLQELLRIPQVQGTRKSDETAAGNTDVLKTDVKGPVRDCLKCDTFAELQERLGCIDGSEIMEVLKSSSKLPPVTSVGEKSQQPKQADRQTDAKPSETPQTALNQGTGCNISSVAEKQTDGAVPGDSFQREDSGLYDCEECSATSSGEELLNQSLKRTCRPDQARNGAFQNSQGFSVHSQEAAAKGPLSRQPAVKQESPEAADWFKADKRTSPVGKSSPMSPPSSFSPSRSLTTNVILGNTLPDHPVEDLKEMKATITVTVQQPLDLKGHDELVFSMVEEVTISGALNRARAGGNIICIRDATAAQVSAQGSASSQPIRIISNVTDESASTDSSNTDASRGQMDETKNKTPQSQFRREQRFLPSFINPMLINADTDCEVEGTKDNETPPVAQLELNRGHLVKSTKINTIPESTLVKKSEKGTDSSFSQIFRDPQQSKDSSWCDKTADNKGAGKRPRSAEKSHPREREQVFSTNPPRASEPVEICSRRVGCDPKRIGLPPGCQETASPPFITSGSLPRGWQNAIQPESYRSGYPAEDRRVPRAVISSTPCSPDVTLKRKQGKHSRENLHVSASRKHGPELKQHASFSCAPPRKSVECLLETSNRRGDHLRERLTLSPTEDGGRHFGAKLEHLVTRSSSLGRSPRDYLNMDRDSSSTSMSSKGSSKGSAEGACKGGYRGHSDRDYTLPRTSRGPRKNPRSDHSHHFFPPEDHVGQSGRYSHSKLSAVGKLKMAGPKVRRLSASSIKNLSLPHKSLRQSVNRSASLSPDGKTVSFERMSSFLSSSPPRSFCSISRTPSQSSTCSSTKSAIQGFVNGRFSDLLRERTASPTSGDPDQLQTTIPSPYSRVTAPRTPDHLSGHASDTTSVLSGDLPPAMGKTSLYFSGRNSAVSSGYDSMVRESEATGSGASTRDSISDRGGSLLSVARSGRSSRRRANADKKPGTMGFL